jgi:hypothetical protein
VERWGYILDYTFNRYKKQDNPSDNADMSNEKGIVYQENLPIR